MKVLEVQIQFRWQLWIQWHMALLLYCGNFVVHFIKFH